MVGTLKNAVLKMAEKNPRQWDTVLPSAVMGYQRRPLAGGPAPIELKIGVKPRMSGPQIPAETADNLRTRSVEVMAVYAVRAERLVDSAPVRHQSLP